MRIGIVMPAFNVAAYIDKAITSVLAQTHNDWVMAIVDDGSTDDTAVIASSHHDARITLIRQTNQGVSAARDHGLTALSAEAILFLDADDWLSPDALDRLANGLSRDAAAIAAVGRYARTQADGKVIALSRLPASGGLHAALLVRNLFANGGHLLIRREALSAAGTFRRDLRYGEDWEYWIRLARAGRFAAVPGAAPLLFVRERPNGAYLSMATRIESFRPCMDAIFDSPALLADLGPGKARAARRRAEAENDWIIGRELIRHGREPEGRRYLRRSLSEALGAKRLLLLLASLLPYFGAGPFRPYSGNAAPQDR